MSNVPIRTLVVDDDTSDVFLLQKPLVESVYVPQFEVVHAEGIDEALYHLTDTHIDVILLDLSLPDGKGLSAFERARAHAPGVPIIVLTRNDEELAAKAVQLGADDYLIKERLDSTSLVHVLLGAVERQRMRTQLQQYAQDLAIGEARFQNLIIKNADGIVVTDANGVVLFVNPAAETLLCRYSEDIIGELFGFPLVAGETTEIDVIRKGAIRPCIAEMRVVQTEWEGAIAYLTSLRDITEHKQLQEDLREAENFSRSILNSIDSHIAVIDEHGTVIMTNNAWMHFREHHNHAAFQHADIGTNYFDACRQSSGAFSDVLDGMMAILRGECDSFELECPYRNTHAEERWFQIRVMPLIGSKHRQLVVAYNEITERKRMARIEAEAETERERAKEQEREIRALLQLTSTTPSTVTSGLFGMLPLHESAPHVFDELMKHYAHVIDLAMERRAFRVEYDTSESLRALAERLGFLKAGPRDVVKIHSMVLQTKSQGVHPVKAQAYAEEGRVMVVELMGYLVSYYRNYALGMSKTLLNEQQDVQRSRE